MQGYRRVHIFWVAKPLNFGEPKTHFHCLKMFLIIALVPEVLYHAKKISFSDSTVLNYQEVKIKLFGMVGTPPGDKWF